MIHYSYKPINEEVIDFITCDKCKTEFYDPMDWQEFHYIRFVSGYTSAFGDENEVMCDLCSKCLKDLIGNFCRYKED